MLFYVKLSKIYTLLFNYLKKNEFVFSFKRNIYVGRIISQYVYDNINTCVFTIMGLLKLLQM